MSFNAKSGRLAPGRELDSERPLLRVNVSELGLGLAVLPVASRNRLTWGAS